MKRALSVIRTLTRRLGLSAGTIAGHTVRIAHTLIGLAGAAMASWGVSMIYAPAGWILGGGFLLWLAKELATSASARNGQGR